MTLRVARWPDGRKTDGAVWIYLRLRQVAAREYCSRSEDGRKSWRKDEVNGGGSAAGTHT